MEPTNYDSLSEIRSPATNREYQEFVISLYRIVFATKTKRSYLLEFVPHHPESIWSIPVADGRQNIFIFITITMSVNGKAEKAQYAKIVTINDALDDD